MQASLYSHLIKSVTWESQVTDCVYSVYSLQQGVFIKVLSGGMRAWLPALWRPSTENGFVAAVYMFTHMCVYLLPQTVLAIPWSTKPSVLGREPLPFLQKEGERIWRRGTSLFFFF